MKTARWTEMTKKGNCGKKSEGGMSQKNGGKQNNKH